MHLTYLCTLARY